MSNDYPKIQNVPPSRPPSGTPLIEGHAPPVQKAQASAPPATPPRPKK